jgi:hypothetical protein
MPNGSRAAQPVVQGSIETSAAISNHGLLTRLPSGVVPAALVTQQQPGTVYCSFFKAAVLDVQTHITCSLLVLLMEKMVMHFAC